MEQDREEFQSEQQEGKVKRANLLTWEVGGNLHGKVH